MTPGGTDDSLINTEGLDGPYISLNAENGKEHRDDAQTFSSAAKSIPRGRATMMMRTKRREYTPAEFVDRTT